MNGGLALDGVISCYPERCRVNSRGALDKVTVISRVRQEDVFAGAELKDVLQFAPDRDRGLHWVEDVKKPMRALESLVSGGRGAEGTALGGGWEISLWRTAASCWTIRPSSSDCRKLTFGLLPARAESPRRCAC